MPEETIDPGLLEQTKNQIRKLVAEIADLAESDIQPAEFYVEFLNRAVAAVAASGGAFWLLDGRGGLKLQHQLEFRLTGLMDGRVKTPPHDALLGLHDPGVAAADHPARGGRSRACRSACNPTELRADHRAADRRQAGRRPARDPDGPDPPGGARRRARSGSSATSATWPARYLKNRQMRQMMSQQRLWNQLEGFTHQIHGSLDLKETAYAVVNDGKRLVGCDRLSVALKIGGRVMVEAVSGQEVVEQRANLVRELTRLCKVVIRSGEDLVYTGNTEGFAPDIRDALEIYVDESGSKVVDRHAPAQARAGRRGRAQGEGAVRLPGRRADRRRGGPDRHARPDRGRRPARLDGALERPGAPQDLPACRVLKAMGSPWRFFRGRTLAKIVAVLAAIVGSDRCPDVRPLDADDRGPRLAAARGAADHLRPGRRHRRRGARRPRRRSSRRATCSSGSTARSSRRS